jgi:hypothetical protein
MKYLRIFFFTLVWGFLGFIIGYLLFARWSNEFVPVKSIFFSSRIEDAMLNGLLRIRFNVCVFSALFALAGLVIILFIEFRGETRSVPKVGFYECKTCGFKSQEKTAFCVACERDDAGFTKADYKLKAEQKTKNV